MSILPLSSSTASLVSRFNNLSSSSEAIQLNRKVSDLKANIVDVSKIESHSDERVEEDTISALQAQSKRDQVHLIQMKGEETGISPRQQLDALNKYSAIGGFTGQLLDIIA